MKPQMQAETITMTYNAIKLLKISKSYPQLGTIAW